MYAPLLQNALQRPSSLLLSHSHNIDLDILAKVRISCSPSQLICQNIEFSGVEGLWRVEREQVGLNQGIVLANPTVLIGGPEEVTV